jgi:hypothetical protein
MTEQQKRRRAMEEAELAHAVRALRENGALMSVAQLINLLQGLGGGQDAATVAAMVNMLGQSRKKHLHRGDREMGWFDSPMEAAIDQHSFAEILHGAKDVIQQSLVKYPYAADELNAILGDVNEQLARLS